MTPWFSSPWLPMALLLFVLGGLMGGLSYYQQRHDLHPEVVRKLFHVGTGMTTLTLPWLFSAVWPVLVVAAVATGSLLAVRTLRALKAGLGGVLGGVSRVSLGEVYFVASVSLLFVLARQTPLLYVIPVLILTWADAVAALIGVSYGQHRFNTGEGRKSTEGSLAFFLVAFFSVHVPLLLFTAVGRAETLLIGLIIGLLLMMFEAASWRGLDNLFIPLSSFMLLKVFLPMDQVELQLRLGLVSLLTLFGLLYRKRVTLSGSALMGAVLVGFLTWTIGGWHWFVMPFLVFLTYTIFSPIEKWDRIMQQHVHTVISVCSVGFLYLFCARTLQLPQLFYPYTLSFACHLVMIGVAYQRYRYPQVRVKPMLFATALGGWGLLFIPFLLLRGFTWSNVGLALLAMPGVLAAAALFLRWQTDYDLESLGLPRWKRQAVCSLTGSLVGLCVMQFWPL